MLARHRRFGRRFDFAAVGCVRELASCMCRARGNNAHTARARPLRLPLSLRRDMAQIGFRAGGGRCGRYGRRFDVSTVSRVRELASCVCRARGEGAHTARARQLRLPLSLRRDMAQIGFRAGGGRCGRFGRRFDFSTVSCVRELASYMRRARGEGAHTARAHQLRLSVSLRRTWPNRVPCR